VPPAIGATLAGLVAQAVIKKAQLMDARCFIFMVYFLVVESDDFRRGEFDDVSTDDAELIADRPHVHFPQNVRLLQALEPEQFRNPLHVLIRNLGTLGALLRFIKYEYS
jgi:hypothetical protein